MVPFILLTTGSIDQFTGKEHTRVITLVTILAAVSVVIWLLVCGSIVLQHLTVFLLKLRRSAEKRKLNRRKE